MSLNPELPPRTPLTTTAKVANSVASVKVTPTVRAQRATVTVDGHRVRSGSASPAIASDCRACPKPSSVVVTAQDGVTT